jgi:hypothetical protein
MTVTKYRLRPVVLKMWKKEIHKFLENNQLAFESIQSQSVFCLLFIPEHQLYLHLIDIQSFQENSLPNTYFQSLSDSYNAQNQRIIHLWEDVYTLKKDLVHARILAMTGTFTRLHARHCIIKRIDKPTADNFLEINHLQGTVNAKLRYGLFLKPQYVERFGVVGEDINLGKRNEKWSVETLTTADKQQSNNSITQQSILVAVATFSGGRTMKEGERAGTRSYELIRFASLKGYVVVGGMDKLLKAFTEEHTVHDIMSYADRDWSDGRSYDKLGFIKMEISEPQTFYIKLKTLERLPLNRLTDDKHLEIFNAGSIKYIKFLDKQKSPPLNQ